MSLVIYQKLTSVFYKWRQIGGWEKNHSAGRTENFREGLGLRQDRESQKTQKTEKAL